jgi:hypothetical protein
MVKLGKKSKKVKKLVAKVSNQDEIDHREAVNRKVGFDSNAVEDCCTSRRRGQRDQSTG